jgi:hypothetical protein
MILIQKFIQKNILIIFIISFIIFYTIIIQKDFTKTFFIIFIIILLYFYWSQKQNKIEETQINLNAFIKSIEDQLKDFEIDNYKIYKIHKSPKSLQYIFKNEYIKQILYEVRFMLIYDKSAYLRMIIYIEYFLKYHFMIMIDRYDPIEYISILKDIRKEILNDSKAFIFTTPKVSTILENNDIESTLNFNHEKLTQITYKYIQIIKYKYNYLKENIYDPPWEYNNISERSLY